MKAASPLFPFVREMSSAGIRIEVRGKGDDKLPFPAFFSIGEDTILARGNRVDCRQLDLAVIPPARKAVVRSEYARPRTTAWHMDGWGESPNGVRSRKGKQKRVR